VFFFRADKFGVPESLRVYLCFHHLPAKSYLKALNIPPGVGGNVVVAQGPVTVQGEHIFRVYKCPWFRVWREIAGGFGKWRAREDSNLRPMA
jgi:hypothetical protein